MLFRHPECEYDSALKLLDHDYSQATLRRETLKGRCVKRERVCVCVRVRAVKKQ